jgi:LAO/AO transport system kinase
MEKAQLAKIQYNNAIHLFPKKDSGWEPNVLTCSASQKTGIAEIWDQIELYKSLTLQNGYFSGKRNQQSIYWMHETIQEKLKRNFYDNHEIKHRIAELEKQVIDDKLSSFMAAGQLLQMYSKLKHNE